MADEPNHPRASTTAARSSLFPLDMALWARFLADSTSSSSIAAAAAFIVFWSSAENGFPSLSRNSPSSSAAAKRPGILPALRFFARSSFCSGVCWMSCGRFTALFAALLCVRYGRFPPLETSFVGSSPPSRPPPSRPPVHTSAVTAAATPTAATAATILMVFFIVVSVSYFTVTDQTTEGFLNVATP